MGTRASGCSLSNHMKPKKIIDDIRIFFEGECAPGKSG